MIYANGETTEQRMARFEREDKEAVLKIADIEAEYHTKGYDKLMSMDEAEDSVMRVFGPLLDLLCLEDLEE